MPMPAVRNARTGEWELAAEAGQQPVEYVVTPIIAKNQGEWLRRLHVMR